MEEGVTVNVGELLEKLERVRRLLEDFRDAPLGEKRNVVAKLREELDRPLNLQVELSALRYLFETWR